ncbi:MAG: penicillin-binding protein 2 [Candidatus Nomurabacteria bacterium]|jgi:cell division protein FtsI/penicillin-binding protein 2|nr:penicillin-binding protein 2 [Candidatus Nomurabacteria bacterium]
MDNRKISRVQIILGFSLLLFIVLAVRLFYIQIIEHDKYSDIADRMQSVKYEIKPERGQIYMRDGDAIAPLVLNEPVYTVFADPQEIDDSAKVAEQIQPIVGDKFETSAENLDKNTNQNRFVVLARGVSRSQAEEIKKIDIGGVGAQAGTRRVYPENSMAAQVLGFVGWDDDCGCETGRYGIEQKLNKELSGTPGRLESVTDVRRIPLTIGQHDMREPAVNGENIVLTLDRNIQAEAETVLAQGLQNVGATRGSMIVMDPTNGAIKAMANFPSYDPAKFNKVTDASVFQNTSVSDPFEPGSVSKVMSTAAAIDSGAVSRESTFYNAGCVEVADAKICNVDRDVDNRTMTMTQVFQYSLNTGVVWELTQMGGGAINDKAKNTLFSYYHDRYRLDQLTGIEQGGENEGMIYSPNHEQGGVVNYANMTFGQGFRTTMIEMITAFSAIVNGGTYYRPHLIAGKLDSGGKLVSDSVETVSGNVVSAGTSEAIKSMMIEARRGYAAGRDRGYNVGAKSGTAEVYDPAIGDYSKSQYIGTYLGFGADAAGAPKYVIMVRVDDSKAGGYAGSTAAEPIWTAMSNWIIDYEGISK